MLPCCLDDDAKKKSEKRGLNDDGRRDTPKQAGEKQSRSMCHNCHPTSTIGYNAEMPFTFIMRAS